MNKDETVADIVREMREWSEDENDALSRYADRIEDAAIRLAHQVKDEVEAAWNAALQSEVSKVMDAIKRTERNFERFATPYDAKVAYRKLPDASLSTEVGWFNFVNWLFSPAKEGGAK